MKRNYIEIQNHIQKAIYLCGEANALSSTKALLKKALLDISNTNKKQIKNNTAAEMYKKEAANNYKKWWDTIQENVKKSAEANLNSKKGDVS